MRIYDKSTHEPCKSAPHSGQVEMTANGFTFMADENLVSLLTALNDAGVQTYSHCAGHPYFSDADDPERVTAHDSAWIALEMDNVSIETRQKDGRTQVIMRINRPPWWHIDETPGKEGSDQ